MQLSALVVAVLAAGANAGRAAQTTLKAPVHAVAGNNTEIVWTTQTVTAFKTFCPSPTSWVQNKKTYTATQSQWVTVTDCPQSCIISYKPGPSPTLVPISVPKYNNNTVPTTNPATVTPGPTTTVCPCATATPQGSSNKNNNKAPCPCATAATTAGLGYNTTTTTTAPSKPGTNNGGNTGNNNGGSTNSGSNGQNNGNNKATPSVIATAGAASLGPVGAIAFVAGAALYVL